MLFFQDDVKIGKKILKTIFIVFKIHKKYFKIPKFTFPKRITRKSGNLLDFERLMLLF